MLEWLPNLLELLLLGAFAGLAAGLLGIGGGMLVVPSLALIFARHMDHGAPVMHFAVATSLASIALTGSASAWAHHRHAAVVWRHVAWLAPGLVVGAFVSAGLSVGISDIVLRRGFGLFAAVVGGKLVLGGASYTPRPPPGAVVSLLAGMVFGAISALAGIGGGSLNVPYLVALGERMQRAVGSAAAAGVPLAVAGSVGYMLPGWERFAANSAGYIILPPLLAIVLASMLVAPLGAHLAHRMPAHQLKRVFGLALMLIGLGMLLTGKS